MCDFGLIAMLSGLPFFSPSRKNTIFLLYVSFTIPLYFYGVYFVLGSIIKNKIKRIFIRIEWSTNIGSNKLFPLNTNALLSLLL